MKNLLELAKHQKLKVELLEDLLEGIQIKPLERASGISGKAQENLFAHGIAKEFMEYPARLDYAWNKSKILKEKNVYLEIENPTLETLYAVKHFTYQGDETLRVLAGNVSQVIIPKAFYKRDIESYPIGKVLNFTDEVESLKERMDVELFKKMVDSVRKNHNPELRDAFLSKIEYMLDNMEVVNIVDRMRPSYDINTYLCGFFKLEQKEFYNYFASVSADEFITPIESRTMHLTNMRENKYLEKLGSAADSKNLVKKTLSYAAFTLLIAPAYLFWRQHLYYMKKSTNRKADYFLKDLTPQYFHEALLAPIFGSLSKKRQDIIISHVLEVSKTDLIKKIGCQMLPQFAIPVEQHELRKLIKEKPRSRVQKL